MPFPAPGLASLARLVPPCGDAHGRTAFSSCSDARERASFHDLPFLRLILSPGGHGRLLALRPPPPAADIYTLPDPSHSQTMPQCTRLCTRGRTLLVFSSRKRAFGRDSGARECAGRPSGPGQSPRGRTRRLSQAAPSPWAPTCQGRSDSSGRPRPALLLQGEKSSVYFMVPSALLHFVPRYLSNSLAEI